MPPAPTINVPEPTLIVPSAAALLTEPTWLQLPHAVHIHRAGVEGEHTKRMRLCSHCLRRRHAPNANASCCCAASEIDDAVFVGGACCRCKRSPLVIVNVPSRLVPPAEPRSFTLFGPVNTGLNCMMAVGFGVVSLKGVGLRFIAVYC